MNKITETYIKIYMVIYIYIYNLIKKNFKAFAVTFIIGFITHAYMFTNLLPNYDTTCYFFELGATFDSGRWGLGLLSYILPKCNMPWLNGLTTLIFISASVCLMIEMFEIKIPAFQYLLGGLIISFPSLTGTFMYLFTSACYGLAIFMMSIAALLITKSGRINYIIALICFVFSLSIYQAYLFFISSLMIVYLIKCTFEGKSHIYRKFMKYILFLLLSLAVYFAINFLFMTCLDVQYNSYAKGTFEHSWSLKYIIWRTVMAYCHFGGEILAISHQVVVSRLSTIIHIIMIILGLILGVKTLKKSIYKILPLLIFLPLSINGISLIGGLHDLTVYSFCVIYILFAVIIQQAECNDIIKKERDIRLSFLATIPLTIILLLNIAGANKAYIKMELANRNTEAFYTGLVTQIKLNPDFKEETKIALIGEADNTIWKNEKLDGFTIQGSLSSKELINCYARKLYIKHFIGFDVDFASNEEIEEIINLSEFAEMSEYPYYNSVKTIGDYIVVKFSDIEQ